MVKFLKLTSNKKILSNYSTNWCGRKREFQYSKCWATMAIAVIQDHQPFTSSPSSSTSSLLSSAALSLLIWIFGGFKDR